MDTLRVKHRRRGIVLVEAALVFPLLLLLTFALIEYGWMFLKMQQTTSAARQAVRVAVLPDTTNAEVMGIVSTLMTEAGLEDSGYTLNIDPGDVEGLSVGTPVTIDISLPYDNIKLVGVPLIPTPAKIETQVTMSKEGPIDEEL